MTTADSYCPTCTSLHAPRLPTQGLTSQLCMHGELSISTDSTLRNHVMLRRAYAVVKNTVASFTWKKTLITAVFCRTDRRQNTKVCRKIKVRCFIPAESHPSKSCLLACTTDVKAFITTSGWEAQRVLHTRWTWLVVKGISPQCRRILPGS